MNLPFLESEPTYEDGRTLLNGNTLDADNKVVEAQAIIVEDAPFSSSILIEEEKGEMASNNEQNENEEFYVDPIHHTQEQMMKAMRDGLGSMFNGLKAAKEKAANVTQADLIESAKNNLEYSKTVASNTADSLKSGAKTAAEIAKENLLIAAQKSKEAALITGQYAGAAWNPVKQKLDETGATAVANKSYTVVAENSRMAANALNQRIDANPSLKYAKDMTTSGLSVAGSMVKSGFGTFGGWFGMKLASN